MALYRIDVAWTDRNFRIDKKRKTAYYLARILFETNCRLGIKEVVLMGSSHMRMGITVKVAR